jgi:hypothetical protein
MTCWFCEKPRSAAAWSAGRAICAQCTGFMAQGVICIGVTVPLETDTVIDKIYRDGNWCVLSRDEYTRRFGVAPPQERFAFVTPEAWSKAGLPKFGKHGASHANEHDAPSILPDDEITEVEEST